MSFITFQQRCDDCQSEWNAAFGIVGTVRIAEPPTACIHCHSLNIRKIADGWNLAKPKEEAV